MPPPRSAAFAVARARLLSAPSPSESTGSTIPSSARHSDASLAIPSTHEEPELDLAGDERRQLHEQRARARGAVGVVSCGLERLVSRLGEGRDGHRSRRARRGGPRRRARRARSRRTRPRRGRRLRRSRRRPRTRRARRDALPSGTGVHAPACRRGAPVCAVSSRVPRRRRPCTRGGRRPVRHESPSPVGRRDGRQRPRGPPESIMDAGLRVHLRHS